MKKLPGFLSALLTAAATFLCPFLSVKADVITPGKAALYIFLGIWPYLLGLVLINAGIAALIIVLVKRRHKKNAASQKETEA